jgi:hypothetical protein
MVTIEISEKNLLLHVRGADRLWALKSELSIPLEHVVSVRADAEVARQWFHGLKLPGTSLPGVITAGTFYLDGKRVFWDIHHPDQALVIVLRDEDYNELVVEVNDPVGTAESIAEAIANYSSDFIT